MQLSAGGQRVGNAMKSSFREMPLIAGLDAGGGVGHVCAVRHLSLSENLMATSQTALHNIHHHVPQNYQKHTEPVERSTHGGH